ncbi:MAG: T9SS type A sorting domain-containing protein [Saprospiraceae bacterium]|nr:T9SS type A sorting domain-containing protein [Saprospiraceae bacterium]
MNRIISFIVFGLLSLSAVGQDQTVGVFLNTPEAENGYTLIAPTASRTTYLIDNCGNVINTWQSDYLPGMVAYLLDDGRLLRACKKAASFSSGGSGGRIEMYNWDDQLIWSYDIADDVQHQHHDLAIMPNGNILAIVWDRRPDMEVIQAGRDPNSIGSSGVWYEKILELSPIGTDSAEIVWEWYLFDHLVQDFDSTKNNYGVIKDSPHRMDINYRNYFGTNPGPGDWFHMNAIDYNPELDQIVFSSRSTNEIYIIDHSTTTQEAASSSGGQAGMGGDFLYRWGNPEAYQRGTPIGQKLFGQHDAQWIDEGLKDAGKIMVFNNGIGRPSVDYSSIEIIDPPLDGFNYSLAEEESFLPLESSWTFTGENETAFFSTRVSGASRLANGNTLICSGNEGRIFEVDSTGNLVWDFINPVINFGPVSQGQVPSTNDMFRAYKYSPDYPAFEDRILFPGPKIENNPWPDSCVIYDNTVRVQENILNENVQVYPNPARSFVTLENNSSHALQVNIFNTMGSLQSSFEMDANHTKSIDVFNWNKGIYFASLSNGQTIKLIIAN